MNAGKYMPVRLSTKKQIKLIFLYLNNNYQNLLIKMVSISIRNDTNDNLIFKSTTVECYKFIHPIVGINSRYYNRIASFSDAGTGDEIVYKIGATGMQLKIFRPIINGRLCANKLVAKIIRSDKEFDSCNCDGTNYQISAIMGTDTNHSEMCINLSSQIVARKHDVILNKLVDEDIDNLTIKNQIDEDDESITIKIGRNDLH